MVVLYNDMDHFNLLFTIVTAAACITGITSCTITIHLALTVLTPGPTSGLAITASAVQIFAIFSLIAATGTFLRWESGRKLLIAWALGAISSIVGIVLSLGTLGSAIHLSNRNVFHDDDSKTRSLSAAGLVFDIIGLTSHIVFYVMIRPRPVRGIPSTVEEVLSERASPTRSTKRKSITVHLSALSPSSPKFTRSSSAPTSPSFSAGSKSPVLLLRDTFRPMTSKTKLLLGSSLISRDSQSRHSGDTTVEAMRSSNDEFGSWDTSAVEEYDNPFASRTKISKLETIPGSRPVSPARPLGAYLSNDSTPEDIPLPDSPVLGTATCTSPTSASSSTQNLPRTRPRRSSSNIQSHIHPLFRAESPVPPPLVSPGTVIIASPYAGQVISPELAISPKMLVSPIGSRPSTPSKSHPASIRSFRVASPSPVPVSPVEVAPKQSFSNLRLPND